MVVGEHALAGRRRLRRSSGALHDLLRHHDPMDVLPRLQPAQFRTFRSYASTYRVDPGKNGSAPIPSRSRPFTTSFTGLAQSEHPPEPGTQGACLVSSGRRTQVHRRLLVLRVRQRSDSKRTIMTETATDLTGPDLSAGVPIESLEEGRPLLGHAAGEAILLCLLDGEPVAVGATCTHYGGPLAEGLVHGDTVRCPWHHACFSLRTGEALRPPALLDQIGRAHV